MPIETLEILEQLVECDTQNPPRAISVDSEVFHRVANLLPREFEIQLEDFGKGRVNAFAVRGKPNRLFNVHLDTVPVGTGWTVPPLKMTLDDGKVYGRGVCDIKGAAACLISTANQTNDDMAILFSTDEEGAESCCIRNFCESPVSEDFIEFVVAEPTGCNAVAGHRGYVSVSMEFEGRAGHTSQFRQLKESANHRAIRWLGTALERVAQFESNELNGGSCCFNVGRLDGGIKNNMIAKACKVTWSARMPSGFLNSELCDRLLNDLPEYASSRVTFDGQPLPGSNEQKARSLKFCAEKQLAIGADVDFWTEAAIFAGTGKPTIVLGPGDIAQAHTANEWVAIEQLERCTKRYVELIQGSDV